MKSIFSVFVVLFFSFQSQAQPDAIEKLFNDYQKNEDFSVVFVGPKMFQMFVKATNNGESDDEFKDVVKDLKGLRIMSTSKKTLATYAEANKRLNANGYEELMTVKDKGSNVRFVTKESNKTITELLLVVGAADNFTMMSFTGKIDLNKISKLAKTLDIKGAEHLDKVNKKK
jgi:hypothetical protein